MDELDAYIDGSIVVDRDLCFHGTLTGTMTVPTGRKLELHGTIGHDLIIEAGAQAVVLGRINGALINRGGDVVLKGHAAQSSALKGE